MLEATRVCELGAGTGVVGLFAAAAGCADVVLTDGKWQNYHVRSGCAPISEDGDGDECGVLPPMETVRGSDASITSVAPSNFLDVHRR